MIEHKGNIRGEDVPLPTWGTVVVEHEIAAGVTIACVGTDLCRYCQAAKRRDRAERRSAKAAASRKERREARAQLRAGEEEPRTDRKRGLSSRRTPTDRERP